MTSKVNRKGLVELQTMQKPHKNIVHSKIKVWNSVKASNAMG